MTQIRSRRNWLVLAVVSLSLSLGLWACSGDNPTTTGPSLQKTDQVGLSVHNPQVQKVMKIQDRATPSLFEDPLVVGDRSLGRKWVRGSAFSLDGVHPGYTGQALIANYVLEQMGPAVGLSPPLEDLETVLATDPYVDNDGDGWAPGPVTSATGVTELMFLFRDPDDGDPAAEPIVPSNVWDMISDLILDELLAIDSVRAEAVRLGIDVNR